MVQLVMKVSKDGKVACLRPKFLSERNRELNNPSYSSSDMGERALRCLILVGIELRVTF